MVQALCRLLEAMAMLNSRSGQMAFSCHQQGNICEWGDSDMRLWI